MAGRKLIEVGDDELTCDARRMTTSSSRPPSTSQLQKSSSQLVTRASSSATTEEPLIIWSLEPTQPTIMKIKTKAPLMKAQAPIISNDDTLIIGIVGGVVAFIAILIIIICIIRLRMSNAEYQQSAAMMGMPTMQALGAHNAAYSYKNGGGGGAPTAALYAVPPYQANYATLPHKAASIHHQSTQNLSQRQQQQQAAAAAAQQAVAAQQAAAVAAYSTMSRMSYFSGAGATPSADGAESISHQQQQQHQPYIIYSDDKAYR